MEKQFILIFTFFSMASTGLTQSFQEKHLAKMTALKHMDTYATQSDLSNKREYKEMLDMFAADSKHVNDILPLDELFSEAMNIDDYRETLNDFLDSGKQKFHVDLDVYEVQYNGSKLITVTDPNGENGYKYRHEIAILARKRVHCIDQYGLNYNESIPMIFELTVQKELDHEGLTYRDAKIVSAKRQDTNERFNYIIIRLSDLGNFSIKKCSDPLLLDTNDGYELYKSVTNRIIFENKKDESDDIERWGDQLSLSNLKKKLPRSSKKDKLSYEFHASSIVDVTNMASPKSEETELSLLHNGGFGVGLGLNYHFKLGKEWPGALRIGLDYFQRSSELRVDDFEWSRSATDPDGFDYERQTQINDYTENLEMEMLLPYFGFKIGKSRKGSKNEIGLDCAVNYGLYLGSSTSNTAQLYHQGYYPELFGITIDDPGIYDFGGYQGSGSDNYNAMESFIRIQSGPYFERRILDGLTVRLKASMAYEIISFETTNDKNIWVEGTQELNSLNGKVDEFQSVYFMPEVGIIYKREPKKIKCN